MSRPIQITRPDVTADVRALAALTGKSLTDTIATAVRAQLAIEKVRSDSALSERKRALDAALAEIRSLPVVGPVIADQDLYDAEGMPR